MHIRQMVSSGCFLLFFFVEAFGRGGVNVYLPDLSSGYTVCGRFDKDKGACLEPVSVSTDYCEFDVTEPVLLELLDSRVLRRLKGVHQYGIVKYLYLNGVVDCFCPEVVNYSRYNHSVGVFALVRYYGGSLKEQCLALLHDVSHSPFSHLADYDLFEKHDPLRPGVAYQDRILGDFLESMHVDEILSRYGLSINELLSMDHEMLDQRSPEVCADRLEYTLQAGLITLNGQTGAPLLSHDDVRFILRNLQFCKKSKHWYFLDQDAAKKFAMVSLYTTEHVVGAAWNHIVYSWVADALREAFACYVFGKEKFLYATDDKIWGRLMMKRGNPVIGESLDKFWHFPELIQICGPGMPYDVIVHTKFRGINPLVLVGREMLPLTQIDDDFAREYARVEYLIRRGWPVKFVGRLAGVAQEISTVIS